MVFKRIENYATDVHLHNIQIPVNLSNIIKTPVKAMETIKTSTRNVYQQSLLYYWDNQKENKVDKHQAHLAAQLKNLNKTQ